MRALIQRAARARVTVAGETVGTLEGPGLVVLLGVTHDDTIADVDWLAAKVRGLRILREEGSLESTGAGALVISQFTLYGDARKGRRPTWAAAAPGPVAEPLYDAFCASLERAGTPVSRGVFGAEMAVELVNDGPVTLMIESPGSDRRAGGGPDRGPAATGSASTTPQDD